MRKETIVKSNGKDYKIEVRLSEIFSNIEYRVNVFFRVPPKRKWQDLVNTDDYQYRALSLEDREKQKKKIYQEEGLSFAIHQAKLALWETLKPSKEL